MTSIGRLFTYQQATPICQRFPAKLLTSAAKTARCTGSLYPLGTDAWVSTPGPGPKSDTTGSQSQLKTAQLQVVCEVACARKASDEIASISVAGMVTCNTGHEYLPAQPVCNGTNTIKQCTPVKCKVPVILNGQPHTGSVQYTHSVTYTCNHGYELKGPAQPTCLADRSLSSNPSCPLLPKYCPPFHLQNLSSTVPASTSNSLGSDAIVVCEPGFQVRLGLSQNTSYHCSVVNANVGKWNGDASCTPVNCTSPKIQNGVRDRSVLAYTQSVLYSCDPGYTLKGIERPTCRADKTLSSVPICELTPKYCPQFSRLNVASTDKSAELNKLGETITLTCNSGYEVRLGSSATASYRCAVHNASIGRWDGDASCISVTCIVPSVANGVSTNKSILYLETVKFTCNNGYQLKGDAMTSCGADRNLTKVPTCELQPNYCPKFSLGKLAAIVPSTNSNKLGETVTVTCQPGYEVGFGTSKKNTYICTLKGATSGVWVGDARCQPVTCSVPMVTNGRSSSASVLYPGTVTFSCDHGYTLVGSATSTCTVHRNLNTLPYCQLRHGFCPPFSLPHVASSVLSSAGNKLNEIVTVSCEPGYKVHNPTGSSSSSTSSRNNYVCTENNGAGTWAGDALCVPVTCPVSSIGNGYRTNKSVLYPNTVTYRCNTGYWLLGNSTPSCQADRTLSSVPACRLVNCSIPAIANGTADHHNILYEKSVTYTCSAGYWMLGVGTQNCTATGELTGLPECIEDHQLEGHRYCSAANAIIKQTPTGVEFNYTTALLVCIRNQGNLLSSAVKTGHCITDVDCWVTGAVTSTTANSTLNMNQDKSTALPVLCEYPCKRTTSDQISSITDAGTVVCRTGYEYLPPQPVCNGNSQVQRCTIVNCTVPPVTNGVRQATVIVQYGDHVNFSCKIGYRLVGNASQTCMPNAKLGATPECRIKTCDLPTGHFDNKVPFIDYLQVVTLSCKTGYWMLGDATQNCTAQGNLTGVPKCLQDEQLTGHHYCSAANATISQNPTTYNYDTALLACQRKQGKLLSSVAFRSGCTAHVPTTEPAWTFDVSGSHRSVLATDSNKYSKVNNLKVLCEFPCYRNTSVEDYIESVMTDGSVVCLLGYEYVHTQPVCKGTSQIHECTVIHCKVPALSEGTSNLTVIRYLESVNFSCHTGFGLAGNATQTCTANGTLSSMPSCLNLDECSTDGHDCHVNALCTDNKGSYTCECNTTFTGNGTYCEQIDECTTGVDDCHAKAHCTNTDVSYTCQCYTGYQGSGVQCYNIDECDSGKHDCDSNSTCVDTAGSFECLCNLGFTGNGTACKNVDECAGKVSPCHKNAACTDSVGSHECTCNTAYQGNGMTCSLALDFCPKFTLANLAHTVASSTGNRLGDNVTVVCQTGYAVQLGTSFTLDNYICSNNHSKGTWIGDATCEGLRASDTTTGSSTFLTISVSILGFGIVVLAVAFAHHRDRLPTRKPRIKSQKSGILSLVDSNVPCAGAGGKSDLMDDDDGNYQTLEGLQRNAPARSSTFLSLSGAGGASLPTPQDQNQNSSYYNLKKKGRGSGKSTGKNGQPPTIVNSPYYNLKLKGGVNYDTPGGKSEDIYLDDTDLYEESVVNVTSSGLYEVEDNSFFTRGTRAPDLVTPDNGMNFEAGMTCTTMPYLGSLHSNDASEFDSDTLYGNNDSPNPSQPNSVDIYGNSASPRGSIMADSMSGVLSMGIRNNPGMQSATDSIYGNDASPCGSRRNSNELSPNTSRSGNMFGGNVGLAGIANAFQLGQSQANKSLQMGSCNDSIYGNDASPGGSRRCSMEIYGNAASPRESCHDISHRGNIGKLAKTSELTSSTEHTNTRPATVGGKPVAQPSCSNASQYSQTLRHQSQMATSASRVESRRGSGDESIYGNDFTPFGSRRNSRERGGDGTSPQSTFTITTLDKSNVITTEAHGQQPSSNLDAAVALQMNQMLALGTGDRRGSNQESIYGNEASPNSSRRNSGAVIATSLSSGGSSIGLSMSQVKTLGLLGQSPGNLMTGDRRVSNNESIYGNEASPNSSRRNSVDKNVCTSEDDYEIGYQVRNSTIIEPIGEDDYEIGIRPTNPASLQVTEDDYELNYSPNSIAPTEEDEYEIGYQEAPSMANAPSSPRPVMSKPQVPSSARPSPSKTKSAIPGWFSKAKSQVPSFARPDSPKTQVPGRPKAGPGGSKPQLPTTARPGAAAKAKPHIPAARGAMLMAGKGTSVAVAEHKQQQQSAGLEMNSSNAGDDIYGAIE
ncbi:sushi, von Willebrand factor type A, EGF and pentraxin domain-containing protein 1-like [Sycon ciliatum]|uniref:sushi, von Willebrand factor type A, EGF and pentraxin domain-containing protein 1-like n=1 Tax=Sycon ciliatum TaxID=27933 RepID=UPI0031F6E60E